MLSDKYKILLLPKISKASKNQKRNLFVYLSE